MNLRRKQQNAILVGPLPQLVPIFLDLGVHGVGLRSVSDGIGEYNDIAVCKKPQRIFAWSGKNAVNAVTEPRIDVQIPMKQFNAKQSRRGGILVVNDTIRRHGQPGEVVVRRIARDRFGQKRDTFEIGSGPAMTRGLTPRNKSTE